MITIDKIKEYIKCPQFGDLEYGKWGALRLEQREAYKHLIEIIEGQEHEISRLNGLIKEIECYSSEDTPEEPKGIPEKLYHCCMETDNEETKFLIKNMNDLVDRYNELLDYLESKGE